MNKAVLISLILALFSTASHAALTSKGYVDSAMQTRQEIITNSETIIVDKDDKTKLKAVEATREQAGVAALGTIPVGANGTSTAQIWVE